MPRMCGGWTWYLGNDFQASVQYSLYEYTPRKVLMLIPQFFAVAPVFIAIFAWRPRLGWAAAATTALASLIAGTIIFTERELTWVDSVPTTYSNDYYIRPWTRIAPYMVGIMLGFAWTQYEDSRSRTGTQYSDPFQPKGSNDSVNGWAADVNTPYSQTEARLELLAHSDTVTGSGGRVEGSGIAPATPSAPASGADRGPIRDLRLS